MDARTVRTHARTLHYVNSVLLGLSNYIAPSHTYTLTLVIYSKRIGRAPGRLPQTVQTRLVGPLAAGPSHARQKQRINLKSRRTPYKSAQ